MSKSLMIKMKRIQKIQGIQVKNPILLILLRNLTITDRNQQTKIRVVNKDRIPTQRILAKMKIRQKIQKRMVVPVHQIALKCQMILSSFPGRTRGEFWGFVGERIDRPPPI